jgi:salicylate hydroxylase
MGSRTPAAEGKITVAIAGGGIAGLALAAGLIKQSHIAVRVYESVSKYRDVGAGLALHLNAIKAMSLIGPELRCAYFEKALAMAADIDTEMATEVILAHGGSKGMRVAELGRAKGRMSVSRSDLLDGFWSVLPKNTVVFGKKLASITAEPEDVADIDADAGGRRKLIQITFTDGTAADADVLIGADGVHSLTRSYLLGTDHPATSPKNHDNWVVYRTMVSMEEARHCIDQKWCGHGVPILLGPRGHVNIIPLNKGTRLSAGVAVRGASNPRLVTAPSSSQQTGDREAGQEQRKLDPDNYGDYTEEAQKIIRMIAKDTSASWKPADHDHAPFYSSGRVAMIGDAAHASLPFAGNGAAQALEDAAVLTALFARLRGRAFRHTAKALKAYDVVRRERSQKVVDLARKFGRVYAYAEDGMHESPEKMREFFKEMSRFTNEFDVERQNREATELFDMLVWLEESKAEVDIKEEPNGVLGLTIGDRVNGIDVMNGH